MPPIAPPQSPGATGETGGRELLTILRDGQPRTRSELVELSGLARSTVNARLDGLRAAGLIGPAGSAASSGGRPPERLAFLPGARTVAAVDIGATHASVGLSDLSGKILATAPLDIELSAPAATTMSAIVDALERLAADVPSPLIGVGLGLPGPVEHATGRPVAPPMMPHWHHLDIPGIIGPRLGVPVFVDNDVNLLALGERALVWPDVDDLLFVKISTGIGAGIIAGGALQRGSRGSAGDLGHLRVPHTPWLSREPGDDRDLEAIAAGPAIAAAIGGQAASAADVAALLAAGDPAAARETQRAGRIIGEVLASVTGLLNPTTIVLGGSIARADDSLLSGITSVLPGRSIPLAVEALRIVPSSAGEHAGLLGAAIMVIADVLDPARALDAFTTPLAPA